MTQNTRIYNKFTVYTMEDCDCRYCLHDPGKGAPCPLPVCCCAEEKAAAMAREQADNTALPALATCRV